MDLSKIMNEKEMQKVDELILSYKKEVKEFLNDYLFAKKMEMDPNGNLDKFGIHLMDISLGINILPDMRDKLMKGVKKNKENDVNYYL